MPRTSLRSDAVIALDAVASYLPPERVPIDRLADRLGLSRMELRRFQLCTVWTRFGWTPTAACSTCSTPPWRSSTEPARPGTLVRYVIHGRSLPVVVPYPANPLHDLCRGSA